MLSINKHFLPLLFLIGLLISFVGVAFALAPPQVSPPINNIVTEICGEGEIITGFVVDENGVGRYECGSVLSPSLQDCAEGETRIRIGEEWQCKNLDSQCEDGKRFTGITIEEDGSISLSCEPLSEGASCTQGGGFLKKKGDNSFECVDSVDLSDCAEDDIIRYENGVGECDPPAQSSTNCAEKDGANVKFNCNLKGAESLYADQILTDVVKVENTDGSKWRYPLYNSDAFLVDGDGGFELEKTDRAQKTKTENVISYPEGTNCGAAGEDNLLYFGCFGVNPAREGDCESIGMERVKISKLLSSKVAIYTCVKF